MPTRFEIRELASGLTIEAREEATRWQKLFAAGFVGTSTAVVSFYWLRGWWWTVLSVLAASAAFRIFSGGRASLEVTNVEFCSRGDIGRKVRKRIVSTSEVRRLEFKEDTFVPTYSGLYAVTPHGATLLLPMLDLEATTEVIRGIGKKFPELVEAQSAR